MSRPFYGEICTRFDISLIRQIQYYQYDILLFNGYRTASAGAFICAFVSFAEEVVGTVAYVLSRSENTAAGILVRCPRLFMFDFLSILDKM